MPEQTHPAFLEEAKGALLEVRSALSTLIHSVGANPTQPQEMSRRFGLDKTLTWKIARFICDDDTFAAAGHLPGRSSVRNLVTALERAGAAPSAAAPVIAAMDRFERIVSAHSGDRETFQVMLGSASDELSRKHGEASRRMYYQGGSAIWGVRARVHVSLHFVAPNKDNDAMMDLAVVAGFIDFWRLRPNVAWTVAARLTTTSDGTPVSLGHIEPMDPALPREEAPLLRQFCSTPTPTLNRRPGRNNVTRFELAEGPIGSTATTTCILGWIARAEVNKYQNEGDLYGEHIVRMSTPVEVLYHDFYAHKSLEFARRPTIHVYGDLPGGPPYPPDNLDRSLPAMEEIVDLGTNPPSAHSPDIAQYHDMARLATERLGWSLSDFHGSRFRLKYPPVPALGVYRYPLPAAPR